MTAAAPDGTWPNVTKYQCGKGAGVRVIQHGFDWGAVARVGRLREEAGKAHDAPHHILQQHVRVL